MLGTLCCLGSWVADKQHTHLLSFLVQKCNDVKGQRLVCLSLFSPNKPSQLGRKPGFWLLSALPPPRKLGIIPSVKLGVCVNLSQLPHTPMPS